MRDDPSRQLIRLMLNHWTIDQWRESWPVWLGTHDLIAWEALGMTLRSFQPRKV